MKKILLSIFFAAILFSAYGQSGEDLLKNYTVGNWIASNDYNTDQMPDGFPIYNSHTPWQIKSGYLCVYYPKDTYTSNSFSNYYTMPSATGDYQVEVESNISASGLFDPNISRDKNLMIVFDAVEFSSTTSGVYVALSNKAENDGSGKPGAYVFLSVGQKDGNIFHEQKQFKIADDGVNYHKVKMLAIGDYYYFYYDNSFIGNFRRDQINPDGYNQITKRIIFVNNKSPKIFYINYYKVNQLIPPSKDITPPSIQLFTPVENGSGIATDDQGKILVSGRVTDDSGVAWVKLNGQDIGSVQQDGYFSFNAAALSSNIIVQACDKVGNVGSKLYAFSHFTGPDSIHIPIIPPTHPPVYHAILIACANYPGPGKNLPNTIPEAKGLDSVLQTYYGFKPENITLLPNGKYDQIIELLRSTLSKMSADDNLLITFSGHGDYNQDKHNPVGYWIPCDGVDPDHGYISSEQIKSMLTLTDCKAQHILIMSDACYSGAFRDLSTTQMNYSERSAYNYSSTKILTSCSFEKSPATSVFMKNVTRALADNATDKNNDKRNYLSDIGLYGKIAGAVTAGSGNEPNIFLFGTHQNSGGNFYFIVNK